MGVCLKAQVPPPIAAVSLDQTFEADFERRLPKLTEIYTLKKVIGQGTFGIVRIGARIDNPNLKVAIKTIRKCKIRNNMSSLINEVEILSSIDHPNIVKLIDFFDEELFFNIVTQFCSGGELFNRIISQGRLTERLVLKYMKKMLRAINHLHKLNICHRDLKPQNFLFQDVTAESELKLIDFGLAHRFQKSKKAEKMSKFVGTPLYIAPEVLTGKYDSKCDMWSLGIIMTLMLTGTHPFNGFTSEEVYKSILNDELNINSHEFHHISKEGKDLIEKLLVKDPALRYSAEAALAHPWMQKAKESRADLTIFQNLQRYKAPSEMWRAAIGILIKYINGSDLSNLTAAFNEIDVEHTGYLFMSQMKAALLKSGIVIPKRELIDIFNRLDYEQNGVIQYSEFLAATFTSKICVDEEMIWTLFNIFDVDKSGEITTDNLRTVFKKLGRNYSEVHLMRIIQEASHSKKNTISFEDFKSIMKQKAIL